MCGGGLVADRFTGDTEIEDGALRCTGCTRTYPVIGGVPRMLPDGLAHLVPPMHRGFFLRYEVAMASFLGRCAAPATDAAASAKRRTLRSYSYQWRKFKEMFPHWEEVFRWSIAPVEPSFFAGKVGLDAGCGYGRSLYYAASYGAHTIGLDLSEAVEAAHANTRALPHAHVVQGDIFQPPVACASLDFVYSIGVLQHLTDPRGGFIGLSRLLKPGASMFVWVYPRGRGRQIAAFTAMRAVSTRLPLRVVNAAALALAVGQWALWIGPHRVLRRMPFEAAHAAAVRIPFTLYARYPFRVLHADWMDGLSVPLVNYYKAADVEDWLGAAGLERGRTSRPWDGRAIAWAPVRQ